MMTQKPYFRDIWALGPPDNGYPGAFPRGLVSKIKRNGWWGKRRIWLFSGSYQDYSGIMVDINSSCRPTIQANCEQLPFKDEYFDFVMLDPPYSKEEAARLYGLPYCNIPQVMNEASRICCSEGYVILLHRLVPFCGPWENYHKKRLTIDAVVGVFTIAGYTNIRALSVWRKKSTLDDFSQIELPRGTTGITPSREAINFQECRR